MSNNSYYNQGPPQHPQQAYYQQGQYPPQQGGYPQQGQYPQGQYPPQGYAPPNAAPQYQQRPVKQSGASQGCLGACLAALCCCCVAEEGCEACADCSLCLEGCC